MKHLLIIPGGGDPKIDEYQKTYNLLKQYNYENGRKYDKIKTVLLLGHKSYNELHHTQTYWNCIKSAKILSVIFAKIDNNVNIDCFDVFARSGGCFICLMALNNYQPVKLKNIICWGPATNNWIKNLFFDSYSEKSVKAYIKEKGLYIDNETFDSFIPFEDLIKNYDKHYKLIIGHGDSDKYSNWEFGTMLGDIIKKNNVMNVEIKMICGNHVIGKEEPGYEDYMNMIFNH